MAFSYYEEGKKRLNLTLGIGDYENLLLVTKNRGIVKPGTCASSILVQQLRAEAEKIQGLAKELPGQTNLFRKERKGKGKDL